MLSISREHRLNAARLRENSRKGLSPHERNLMLANERSFQQLAEIEDWLNSDEPTAKVPSLYAV
jgi:hypothetical protein